MKRFTTGVFLGIVLLSSFGCMSSGTKIDQNRVTEIKKGETTEADVIQMFGQPNRSFVNSDGTKMLMWNYHESRTKGTTYIPYAGIFLGGSDSSSQSLTVNIGPSGKVTNYSSSGGSSELRRMIP